MISKWFEFKERAVFLRKSGTSIGVIERTLGVPRSTLSGWFRNIKLTKKQKAKIMKNASVIMSRARVKAVIWHNKQKENRILKAEEEAFLTLSRLDIKNKDTLELALSFLYMGEGAKKDLTSMSNSNPLVLKFFIRCLKLLYDIETKDLKCNIHIRNDQSGELLKKYWSRELKIPIKNFGACLVDKRTVKSKTYSHYKGVCVVRAGKVAIQRKLVFLSNRFCDKIINMDD